MCITNPVFRAQALLAIAESGSGNERAAVLVPTYLRQGDDVPESVTINILARYVDVTGDRGPLDELLEMARDETVGLHYRIMALATVIERTGDRSEIELVDGLIEEFRINRARGGFHFDISTEWAQLARGLNDTSYAMKIRHEPYRNKVLLEIAERTGSVDPILLLEQGESRDNLLAQFYTSTDNLEDAKNIESKQAREHAIIGIATRRGDPDIVRILISDEARDMVCRELLDPDTEFLISEDGLMSVDDFDDFLAHLGKRYRSGDQSVGEAIDRLIDGMSEPAERFPDLLSAARVTQNVTYAYRALDDWQRSDGPYKTQWGVAILDTIRTLPDAVAA
jgi:hypothetical protein